jgi:ferredoxin
VPRSWPARTRPWEVLVKIVVDFDKCKSNAVCMGIAPEVFEVRDDGYLYVLQEEPPESMRPQMEEAVRLCPTQAISIEG